jgi:hypothetical protein
VNLAGLDRALRALGPYVEDVVPSCRTLNAKLRRGWVNWQSSVRLSSRQPSAVSRQQLSSDFGAPVRRCAGAPVCCVHAITVYIL